MRDGSPFRRHADESPGFLLWNVTTLWQVRLGGVLASFGITQTQYAILASLRSFEDRGEPPTQTHLAEHAKIEKMTLSKAIRALEDDGMLARKRSSDDSRAVNVCFTAKGRRVIERAVVEIEEADDQFFGSLPARDLARYKELSRRIIDAAGAANPL
jgi:DNA-binding MarR family transcriptional regulator